MLFVTNRALEQDIKFKAGRKVNFDLKNNEAAQSVYYCRRKGKNDYHEIGSTGLLDALKAAKQRQLLVYLHGYSNLPEPDIFPRAAQLQKLCDAKKPDEVLVLPLIWPCDADFGVVKDYYDDQIAADASAIAFARVFARFLEWREKHLEDSDPCLKRINVLAHSMGNRVLRGALAAAVKYFCPQGVPLVFRNTFLVAADIVNESLEPGQDGEDIPPASRNVVAYFASDDCALRASKVANVVNNVASRRLGHTGPEDMGKVPRNVFAVDCDDVNTKYDFPTGHSYFLTDGSNGGGAGRVFDHIWECMLSGRPPGVQSEAARLALV